MKTFLSLGDPTHKPILIGLLARWVSYLHSGYRYTRRSV